MFGKNQIEEYARTLIHENGASAWTFGWMRGRRTLGRCWLHSRQALRDATVPNGRIELSEPVFLSVGIERLEEAGLDALSFLEEVILHEVAHALDLEARGTSDHGWTWKCVAREIGANPERSMMVPNEIQALMAKWVMICPTCAHRIYFFGRPTRRRSCGACSQGGFTEVHELELLRNDEKVI